MGTWRRKVAKFPSAGRFVYQRELAFVRCACPCSKVDSGIRQTDLFRCARLCSHRNPYGTATAPNCFPSGGRPDASRPFTGRLPKIESGAAPLSAVVCHPHPLFGGTMHNKVVYQTAKTLHRFGMPVLRFNFRGVGASEGQHDHGHGEGDDVTAALDFLAADIRARRCCWPVSVLGPGSVCEWPAAIRACGK